MPVPRQRRASAFAAAATASHAGHGDAPVRATIGITEARPCAVPAEPLEPP
ncbi:hypothetical protein [Acidovorax sp. NCPPB 4044]|uniref:hypothetical protein n=1 Tax=Acidovorax sp. NCPPB 4044 TaxID=2940490 RepID=UPI002302BE7F|nr:hypothetical protein [Acidovorax sp. NCPPB 4044]MDA8520090.1 hypothetical protein [Acidovorax sp. NCPPB 4044]